MDYDTKRALERAGLQLVDGAEVLRAIGEILGAEIIDLTPERNSFGTLAGCEKHNRINCSRCEGGR